MKKTILLFSFLLGGVISIPMAEDMKAPQKLFEEANQFFEKENYEQTLEIYQNLILHGWGGTALYYNLGNLHYRMGSRGKAILWYERARRQSPRDADVNFNLSLVRSHIKEEQDSIFSKVIQTLKPDELCWLVALLIWIFFMIFGFTSLGWIKSEVWPSFILWTVGLLLFILGGWLGADIALANEPTGIVTLPPGEVRNGPGEEYAVGFTIPEGSKVLILKKRTEWTQVGVPQQGLKGWVPTEEVESIVTDSVLSN